MRGDRAMAILSGAFGSLAALLATLGLYGVMSYMIARRRKEIGVRMALGADRRRVVQLILKEAILLLAVGLVMGVALSLWAGQVAEKLLFGVQPRDAVSLGGAVVLLSIDCNAGRLHSCATRGSRRPDVGRTDGVVHSDTLQVERKMNSPE